MFITRLEVVVILFALAISGNFEMTLSACSYGI